MPRPNLLSHADVLENLAARTDWALLASQDTIEKTYVFANFCDAIAFINRGAEAAEALDHHPEWCNTYNRVVVRLSTHHAHDDAGHATGGLTALDFALADAFDALC